MALLPSRFRPISITSVLSKIYRVALGICDALHDIVTAGNSSLDASNELPSVAYCWNVHSN